VSTFLLLREHRPRRRRRRHRFVQLPV